MNEEKILECDNQMYQNDLTKCCECKKPFIKGQEYGELKNKKDNKVSMNSCLSCLSCGDKGETNKKKWEN